MTEKPAPHAVGADKAFPEELLAYVGLQEMRFTQEELRHFFRAGYQAALQARPDAALDDCQRETLRRGLLFLAASAGEDLEVHSPHQGVVSALGIYRGFCECFDFEPQTDEQFADTLLSALRTHDDTLEDAAKPPKHKFWRAGEHDCPRDIKAGNGELHTLQCKVCGEKSPPDEFCWSAQQPDLAKEHIARLLPMYDGWPDSEVMVLCLASEGDKGVTLGQLRRAALKGKAKP